MGDLQRLGPQYSRCKGAYARDKAHNRANAVTLASQHAARAYPSERVLADKLAVALLARGYELGEALHKGRGIARKAVELNAKT